MQQLLSKIYVTTEEPVVKGASVTTEATAIPGAPATTEVQNNSAEVQNNSASASDPVDAEAPAKILIPLEHCRCAQNGVCTQAGLGKARKQRQEQISPNLERTIK